MTSKVSGHLDCPNLYFKKNSTSLSVVEFQMGVPKSKNNKTRMQGFIRQAEFQIRDVVVPQRQDVELGTAVQTIWRNAAGKLYFEKQSCSPKMVNPRKIGQGMDNASLPACHILTYWGFQPAKKACQSAHVTQSCPSPTPSSSIPMFTAASTHGGYPNMSISIGIR